MWRYTNRALLISLGLHFILVLTIVPLLIQHRGEFEDGLSVVLLEPEPVRRMRKRVLRQREPLIQPASRAKTTKASTPSRASPSNAVQRPAPKAPLHLDVATVLVTHADLPEMNAPALPNASLGKSIVWNGGGEIDGHDVAGVEGPGPGGGDGVGQRFAIGTRVDDLGLGDFAGAPAGLGIFDTTVMPGHGLVGTVYVTGTLISKMPAFERLTPIYTFITGNLDVYPRIYTEGFPTSKMQTVVENFAIRFRGKLAIETPGKYTFALNSDDGAKLYINRNLIVNNDGIHPPQYRRGSRKLTAGMHTIEIHYFQGPRYQIALQWLYQPPKGREQIVPPEIIYLPETPRVPKALKGLQDRLNKIRN